MLLGLLCLPVVTAFQSLYSGQACQSCLMNANYLSYANFPNMTASNFTYVCKSKYNPSVAYCCSELDFATHSACISSPLCSHSILNKNMRGVVCPHEKWSCGRSSPDIVVSFNQSETINVGRYLDTDEVCHYSFRADEMVYDPTSYKRI